MRHKLLLSRHLELLRAVRVEIIEGVLAVELAERHDGVIRILAAHHYQVAEASASVYQGDAELQVHLVQSQVCGGNVVAYEGVSSRSWTFSQRRVAPPRKPHFVFRLRSRITDCATRNVMEFMVEELAGLQAFQVGRHVWCLVLDGAVICRSGRKRLAEKVRFFFMLMMIMITSSIEMWYVVAHLAHVNARRGP